MAGYSMELVLAIGYAFLAIIAFILELIARSMHQRTRELSPVSFTYHPERDGWNCPPRPVPLSRLFRSAERQGRLRRPRIGLQRLPQQGRSHFRYSGATASVSP